MKEGAEWKFFLLFEEGSSLGSTALSEAALEGAVGGSATPLFPGHVALVPSSPRYVHIRAHTHS